MRVAPLLTWSSACILALLTTSPLSASQSPRVRYHAFLAHPLRAVWVNTGASQRVRLFAGAGVTLFDGPGGLAAFQAEDLIRVYRGSVEVYSLRRPGVRCVGWLDTKLVLELRGRCYEYDARRQTLAPSAVPPTASAVVRLGNGDYALDGVRDGLRLVQVRTGPERLAHVWNAPREGALPGELHECARWFVVTSLTGPRPREDVLWVIDTRGTAKVVRTGGTVSGICAGRSSGEVLVSLVAGGPRARSTRFASFRAEDRSLKTLLVTRGSYNLVGYSDDRLWLVATHIVTDVGPAPLVALRVRDGAAIRLERAAYECSVAER